MRVNEYAISIVLNCLKLIHFSAIKMYHPINNEIIFKKLFPFVLMKNIFPYNCSEKCAAINLNGNRHMLHTFREF